MKFLIDAFDILGAVVSSKMTGDLRSHFKWILSLFLLALAAAYFQARS